MRCSCKQFIQGPENSIGKLKIFNRNFVIKTRAGCGFSPYPAGAPTALPMPFRGGERGFAAEAAGMVSDAMTRDKTRGGKGR